MVALCGRPDPSSPRFLFGSLFMRKVKQRNSILTRTSPRIKRCAVVDGRAMPASEKSANSSTQDGYKPEELHRCSSSRCALCPKLTTGSSVSTPLTGRKYQVVGDSHMSCNSRHVVYLISCMQCGFQYVGKLRNSCAVGLINTEHAFGGQTPQRLKLSFLHPRVTR